VSARRRTIGRAAGRLLLNAYPEAWRERYREEMLALLDDDPPGVRGLASLLVGAADAHLRPQASWSERASALARMRLSVGAIFACWIAVSLAGVGFQRTIEDERFLTAAHRHILLAGAEDAIVAGALIGALAVAWGGLPLLWRAVRLAVARRDRRLARLLALPPLAVAGFVGVSRLLVALAPARHGAFPATFVLAAGAPWLVCAIACAAVCALTPPAVLRRVLPSRAELRRASAAGVVLSLAMCLVTGALLVYVLVLCLQAPALSATTTGPLGTSTAVLLAAQCLLATSAAALALRSAVRIPSSRSASG